MSSTTVHSLVYAVKTTSDLKGLVATKAEISAASKIINETRQPIEAYKQSLEGLGALHRKGALDAEQHRRAVGKLSQEFKEAQAAGKGSAMLGGAGNVLGALGLGLGVGAGASFLKQSITEADLAAQAQHKLAAVLHATGNASGFTAEQLEVQAKSLQQLTNFGDEQIMSGQAVLATFKEIKGETFTSATKAAMDMSSVLGTDLQSSVLQVGKSLNDPIAGMTALSRAGVSFTADQKEQIKTLQETGDLLGAQKIILAELANEFGGAAEKMRSPLTALSNEFGDLQEAIGGLTMSTGILGLES